MATIPKITDFQRFLCLAKLENGISLATIPQEKTQFLEDLSEEQIVSVAKYLYEDITIRDFFGEPNIWTKMDGSYDVGVYKKILDGYICKYYVSADNGSDSYTLIY